MFITYVVVAALLALILLASGRAKLVKDEKLMQAMAAAGVPGSWIPRLALVEIAAALGLLIGVFWRPLGIAAAVGLVAYFIGALITHLRAKDTKGMPLPAVILIGSAAALIFGIASA